MSVTEPFDPFQPRMRDDPYPVYARLRERDPVHYSERVRSWVLTRHADVVSFFDDHRRLSSDRTKASKYRGPRTGEGNFQTDAPRHTRIRGLVTNAFTPRVIARMEPRVREVVDGLIEAMASQRETDLVEAFAYPLPMTVIAEILGVPVSDHERFQRWGRGFAESVDHTYRGPTGGPLAAREMGEYFAGIVPERRARPADDLISDLLGATEGDDSLTEAEVIGVLVALLLAGHETTVNLIGNGMLSLLRHPGAFERVREEDVARPMVEELLRFESPAQIISRAAVDTVSIGDRTIGVGDSVIGLLGAANRDPDVFDEPDRLDVTRDPNPHIAFGHGVHFCLGAQLSRLEARIAIPALVRAFPDMRAASDEVEWRPTAVLRGLERLPVTLR